MNYYDDGYPLNDGVWFDCHECGGDGWIDRYDEDPLWYGHELYRCQMCLGEGGWLVPYAEVAAARGEGQAFAGGR